MNVFNLLGYIHRSCYLLTFGMGCTFSGDSSAEGRIKIHIKQLASLCERNAEINDRKNFPVEATLRKVRITII